MKKLEFTEEEIKELRLALTGNIFYNNFEEVKRCSTTMLPTEQTEKLLTKIREFLAIDKNISQE